MKKKIAVVLNTEPEWGGEHQYAVTVMDCLKVLADNMIELVAICSNSYWRLWCRENRIRVLNASWFVFTEREEKCNIKYPLFSRLYCMYVAELGKVLRKEKVDAIFGMNQGIFVPNIDIKVIIPVHDLMHRYESKFPEVSSTYGERERIFISKAKYAWCVLTDSKLGKRQFSESYYDNIGKRLSYIISMPFVVPEHILKCEEEFVEVPSKYIFYPAQFWQHKNHINLLEAVRLLKNDIPDIHLLLIGSEKNALKKVCGYISDNKLNDNVTIKGFVSDAKVTYLYRHAVGMVMPSYFGPTNIPPLEAMALGCPVAVANKYAMPEQVGNAGLLFDPDSPKEIAECIKKMWCDEDLRKKMIVKGYDKINKWTKKEFGEKLKRIIEKI